MDGIWIRSQDKSLLMNCKIIEITEDVTEEDSSWTIQGFSNANPVGNDESNMWEGDFELGYYHSQEKAERVLDDIHQWLNKNHLNPDEGRYVFQLPPD